MQDTWQPTPFLTINLGLRWEAQLEPDLITPINELFFAHFIGTTQKRPGVPLRRHHPVGHEHVGTARGHRVGRDEGRQDPRARQLRDLLRARPGPEPGIDAFDQRLDRPEHLPRQHVPQLRRTASARVSEHPSCPPRPAARPTTRASTRSTRTFRTRRPSQCGHRGRARDLDGSGRSMLRYNYADTKHLTRFVDRNAPELGSSRARTGLGPLVHGLGDDGPTASRRSATVESTAKSRYWGLTLGVNKRFSDCFGVQFNYTYSEDQLRRRQRARPLHAPLRQDPRRPQRPDVRVLAGVLLVRPRPAPPPERLDALDRAPRDQLQRPVLVSVRPAPRRHGGRVARHLIPVPLQYNKPRLRPRQRRQPLPRPAGHGHAAQPRPQGQHPFDVRPAPLPGLYLLGGFSVEPIIDIFNVFNADNFLVPQVTNLVFNFDGTVRSGAGEPRRFQFGLRLLF